jgi:hypothetical protein
MCLPKWFCACKLSTHATAKPRYSVVNGTPPDLLHRSGVPIKKCVTYYKQIDIKDSIFDNHKTAVVPISRPSAKGVLAIAILQRHLATP